MRNSRNTLGEGAVITQEGNLTGHGEKQDRDTDELEEKTPQSFCIIQWGVRCWLRCNVSWDKGITDPLHIFAFSYNVYVYLHTISIIIINNNIIRLFEDLNSCRPTFLVTLKMLFSVFWLNFICRSTFGML